MSDTDELPYYVERMMRDRFRDGAFLIITVSGSDDFLQLIGDDEGVRMDFPLITDRQISLESKIRLAAEMVGREVMENEGEGGERFLDIDVMAEVAEVARVCRVMLREVFGAGEGARLEFEEGVG